MKKKILVFIMIIGACLSLAACGVSSEEDTQWIVDNKTKLSDEITSGEIMIDGEVYTFPMYLQDFLDNGFHISNNYENTDTFKLKPGYSSTEFELFKDKEYVKVSVINMTDEDIPLSDGLVEYLCVRATEFDFLLPQGITKRNTLEDIEKAYDNAEITGDSGYRDCTYDFTSKDGFSCQVELNVIVNDRVILPLSSVKYSLKATSSDGDPEELCEIFIDSALKASFYNDYEKYVAYLYDTEEGAQELYDSEVSYYASYLMYYADINEEYMTEDIYNEFYDIAKTVLSKVKWEISDIQYSEADKVMGTGSVTIALYPTNYLELIDEPIEEAIDKYNAKYPDEFDSLDEATAAEIDYANMVLEAVKDLENSATTGSPITKSYNLTKNILLTDEQWSEIDDVIMGIVNE